MAKICQHVRPISVHVICMKIVRLTDEISSNLPFSSLPAFLDISVYFGFRQCRFCICCLIVYVSIAVQKFMGFVLTLSSRFALSSETPASGLKQYSTISSLCDIPVTREGIHRQCFRSSLGRKINVKSMFL